MNEKYKKLLSEEEIIKVNSEYFIMKQPSGGGDKGENQKEESEKGSESEGEGTSSEDQTDENSSENNSSEGNELDSLSEIEGELDELIEEMQNNGSDQSYEESNEETENPEKRDDSDYNRNPFNGTSSYELTDGENLTTSVKKDREFLKR